MKLRSSLTAVVLPFALLSSVCAQQAQIRINASQATNSVSPYLGTGACLEDVNHEVYGGIYSQMIFGESFQGTVIYSAKPPRLWRRQRLAQWDQRHADIKLRLQR